MDMVSFDIPNLYRAELIHHYCWHEFIKRCLFPVLDEVYNSIRGAHPKGPMVWVWFHLKNIFLYCIFTCLNKSRKCFPIVITRMWINKLIQSLQFTAGRKGWTYVHRYLSNDTTRSSAVIIKVFNINIYTLRRQFHGLCNKYGNFESIMVTSK